MDGAAALAVGLIAVGLIAVTPMAWLKAAGGLLLALTVGYILIDAARLLAG